MNSLAHDYSNRESGIAMVLVALLSTVLIGLLGLAIDTYSLSRAKAQLQARANHAALAAAHKFNTSEGSNASRLNAAHGRAREVAAISDAKEWLSGKILLSTTPGKWHPEHQGTCEASTPTPCPCSPSGTWAGPCFQEFQSDNGSEPNAFRTTAERTAASPVERLFGFATGSTALPMSAAATAAIVESRLYVLQEATRASFFETHEPYEYNPTSTPAEFAFRLKRPSSCPKNNCRNVRDCRMKGGALEGTSDGIWNYLTVPKGQRPALPTSPQEHFAEDYQCFDIEVSDTSGNKAALSYLIDTFGGTDTTSQVACPQPFCNMLHAANTLYKLGLSQAAGKFRFGFGSMGSWNVPQRHTGMLSKGEAATSRVAELLDPHNQARDVQKLRYEQYLLFPLDDYGIDLMSALRTADEALLKSNADGTHPWANRDLVLLLSAGVSECITGICENGYSNYAGMKQEIESYLQQLAEKGVKTHVISFGAKDRFGPHRILYPSLVSSNSCMWEQELKRFSPPLALVNPAVDYSRAPTTLFDGFFKTFYEPLHIVETASSIGGSYAPIRDCCEVDGKCRDITSTLNAACSKVPFQHRSLERLAPVAAPGITDAHGRLLCDPNGFSKVEQVENAVTNIVEGKSPYVLVQ